MSQSELDRELVVTTLDYRRFARLELESDDVWAAAQATRSYAEFVSALYDRFAENNDKPLAGEKTPDYVRYIPLLNGLFPWAKFVHIIRDGRDVALSALNWAHEGKGPGRSVLWGEHPVAACALWWRRFVESGRFSGQALGSVLYTEMKYEELVAQPKAVLAAASVFLQLPYNDKIIPGRSQNLASSRIGAVLAAAADMLLR